MKVLWERLDPDTIERMSAVLLSLDNPEVQRIDGRGGDGGRDAQFRGPDGIDFYEIKSFADRIDSRRGRRIQVERSLAQAAKRSPRSWTLVVPVDPTDDEEAWFDGLRARYDFPLGWWGLNWLDGQLAKHPEVSRYYVADERNAVLDLLREYDALGAAAADVGAALGRLDALQAQVRLLDPHLILELTTLPLVEAVEAHPGAVMYAQRPTAIGPVTVAVLPRYPGAARDSDVPSMTVSLRFPDTEEGRAAAAAWEGIHAWGESGEMTPQVVDITEHTAPGGLGGLVGPATLTFTKRTPSPGSSTGRLDCLRDDRRVASLPVALDHLGAGDAGVSFAGHDATGSLTFNGRVGPPEVLFSMSCEPAAGVLPASVLPALRLAEAARLGAELEVMLDSGGETIRCGTTNAPTDGSPSPYLSFVESLASLQDLTRTPFALPPSVTPRQAADIARLEELLREGVADEPASDSFIMMLLPGVPSIADTGYLVVEDDGPEEVLGQQLDIGPRHIVFGPCRTEMSAAENGPPGTTRMELMPEPGARRITRLGPVAAAADGAASDGDD